MAHFFVFTLGMRGLRESWVVPPQASQKKSWQEGRVWPFSGRVSCGTARSLALAGLPNHVMFLCTGVFCLVVFVLFPEDVAFIVTCSIYYFFYGRVTGVYFRSTLSLLVLTFLLQMWPIGSFHVSVVNVGVVEVRTN